jgi:hypothetical protein
MPAGFRRDATIADAAEYRERWGCPRGPAAGAPLPPDLAAEARHVATVTGTPEATTCPLACITYADPWVVEVTRAVALAADLHVPLDDQLGRDLTRADLAALSALKKAQGDAWQSDEKIREQKRENERKAAARGAR